MDGVQPVSGELVVGPAVGVLRVLSHLRAVRHHLLAGSPVHVVIEVRRDGVVVGDGLEVLHVLEPVLLPGGDRRGEPGTLGGHRVVACSAPAPQQWRDVGRPLTGLRSQRVLNQGRAVLPAVGNDFARVVAGASQKRRRPCRQPQAPPTQVRYRPGESPGRRTAEQKSQRVPEGKQRQVASRAPVLSSTLAAAVRQLQADLQPSRRPHGNPIQPARAQLPQRVEREP